MSLINRAPVFFVLPSWQPQLSTALRSTCGNYQWLHRQTYWQQRIPWRANISKKRRPCTRCGSAVVACQLQRHRCLCTWHQPNRLELPQWTVWTRHLWYCHSCTLNWPIRCLDWQDSRLLMSRLSSLVLHNTKVCLWITIQKIWLFWGLKGFYSKKVQTWTPRIAKIIKNEHVIRTVFPIGFKEDNNDVTTSFNPGALLIARNGLSVRIILRILSRLKTRTLFLAIKLMITSASEATTRKKSTIFQPLFK